MMARMKRAQRIALLGAESTGKSSLASALANVMKMRGHSVSTIDEVPREWCQREGRTPQLHEQMGIAQTQVRVIEQITQGWVISDTTPIMTAVYSHVLFNDKSLYPMALAHQALFDTTLLTGLDLPWLPDGSEPHGLVRRGQIDTLIRQTLEQAGIAYRVVYGHGHQRLNNALMALGLPGEDLAAKLLREQSQFAINEGRTVWQCNECSDPDCEHKLFTGLMAKRPLFSAPSRPEHPSANP
jgi:HTH-type transcriptional repressor of NAD biosynthesis genes